MFLWYKAELNPRVRCAFGNVSFFPLLSKKEEALRDEED